MPTRIPVVEKILSANDRMAERNQNTLDQADVFAINIMASPGAGKTSVILKTLETLQGRLRLGVVEGDLASSIDAEKAAAAGLPAVQINTGGECHLDAAMLSDALPALPLSEIDLLLVENVGNLVCPANFQIGTHLNVLIASIPEGDDKPYKYPGMYRDVQALIINKIDLLPYVPFNMEYFRRGVEVLNPGLVTFAVSAKTGEGMAAWTDWLVERVKTK
ncbi:MAG: hydrogenase nickel incorporation protein HypB [Anaerolineales bacterium]|jgi:hydrogenase nickel incorporation protein HypB|uniref:hydrogenase nickel incorporation protein HypB n=1 Tax=Candidatus Villigracilis affinis TaxID=3140682 RepID=UPI001E07CE48|nr:hydrogenase nickel incorporation protein HypB [Anaerolineales bacterium]MBK9603049.1 hydrogenase nickel incorporation protein HypB [Anaerolineales bacterium]MBL0346232.1 hydrogenase nickel incorporation protein HypB [Anaerolineales bacterium]MBL0346989.1 hydrogenase nickel incorporation protein HypB [Anaerolineales bacterium]